MGYSEVSADGLNVVNRVLAEQSFQNASNKIDHDRAALFVENSGELGKYLHALRCNNELGDFAYGCAVLLDMQTKFSCKLEDGMGCDVLWNIFMAFFLVSNVN